MVRMAITFNLRGILAHSWIEPLHVLRRLGLNTSHHRPPLVLDCQTAVGYPLTLHLSPWQSEMPFAWESRLEGELVASGAFLDPSGIGWELLYSDADILMSGMPETVRSVIHTAPFLGVELAQVCGQLEAAQQLAASSPLLLILLVERGVHEGWSRETFSALLAERQAVQCSVIGLPESKACAKLLRRCALRPMSRRNLPALVRTLQHKEDNALLRHHPSLNLAHLVFLSRYEGPLWPGLLELINDCLVAQPTPPGSAAWLQRMLADTSRMLPATSSALDRVRSTTDLQHLHDRLVRRFNAELKSDNRNALELQRCHGVFPTPPFQGTETIIPITSWQGLLREGQRMVHCVGSYDRAVALGHLAIYHMHHPQAVTIAIAHQGNRWTLREARGVNNTVPLPASQKAIQSWLKQQHWHRQSDRKV